jgi:predicted RNA binding protein YcfA (HicA-like mRNA interferase family)
MSKLQNVSARELVRVAQRLGFVFRRQKGSHAIYKREHDGRRVVIPMHGSRSIAIGTLKAILKDMDISADDLTGLL